MNNLNDIFVSQNQDEKNDIAGKITYTDILESIPGDKLDKPIENWNSIYKTEWRWRFLKLTYKNKLRSERYVLEISYVTNNQRYYFNRFGEWVKRDVDPQYDYFVDKEYYVYTM